MAKISVRVSEELYTKLEKAIKASGYETISEFLREKIREFVKEYEED